MTNHVIVSTDNNIFIIPCFFFQHFAFGNFQAVGYSLNHLKMFSV